MTRKIVSKSGVVGGDPCFKGTRIPVWAVLEALSKGKTFTYVLAQYPRLTVNDIEAALIYCSKLVGRVEK